ncbi:flagellar assembly protein FliH [Noviherbaspirillum galbum]|uniref:Flagellar assembly protein FliH n=1 Tax=Noviherbaspirillum galbum TaxID=2709383 RepID=A0A6B3SUX3_9BURK|nr:flagellar assembly protein FliH [Noviherbaspirillum galbum]NEX62696.1 flagellar assembly protein FliH [Noviherbaspirillum galbum]
MSRIIPKEQLSAYQRWELASFSKEDQNAQPKQSAEELRRQEEELAALREEARQQGYAAGYTTGYEDGHGEGTEAGRAEGAQESAMLKLIVAQFQDEVGRANERVAEDMLNLSLDLAKAMLKTALKVRPELVLPIVSEAIRYLPSLQPPALLVLHPDDAHIVRAHIADEVEKGGWRIAEDVAMERGGCRVETASNQIDAALSTRWQRLADSFGRQSGWLE